MALSATSVRLYVSANHPDSDGETSGGAIDALRRVLETAFSGAATPQMVSDDANDLMNVTIVGRTPAGAQVSETNALNGTSAVTWTNSMERVLSVEFASAPDGNVELKEGAGGTVRHTFLPTERGCRTFFINASADVTGGSTRVRYEKFFIKNVDSDEDALNLTVEVVTNPRSDYAIQIEDAVDDNNSVANRLATAPTGNLGAFSSGPSAIPGTDLGFGEAAGVWLRQTLDAGTTPGLDVPQIEVFFQDIE
jgi:hypothetical protein